MRLFAALYPPPAALDDLEGQLSQLRIGEAAALGVNVRMPARESIHVTLAFLGDLDDNRLSDAETALGRAVQLWRGARGAGPGMSAGPLLRLGGGGQFGEGPLVILWVGLAGEVAPVRRLNAVIRRELRRDRLPHDDRPFRPHLTVARPGDRLAPDAVDADRAALDRYLGPAWPVTEMVLVRSHLGPRPAHHPITAWPL